MQRHSQGTRRSFLKQLGAAGAGAAWALPQLVPARAFGAGDTLNIAMLASGGRSQQLLPSILQAGANVVAICDVDTRRIAQWKKGAGKHGAAGAAAQNAKVFDDYRRLL